MTYRSVTLPVKFIIQRESFFVFPTLSTLYCLCRGGISSALVNGIFDDVDLFLYSGVSGGGFQEHGGDVVGGGGGFRVHSTEGGGGGTAGGGYGDFLRL